MNDIQISEQKLEDFIFQHLSGECYFDGFECLRCVDKTASTHSIHRQFNLGAYGIPDIVKIEVDETGYIFINVYELKKDSINKDTLIQALRYQKGFNYFLNKEGFNHYYITLHLIGGKLSASNGFDVAVSSIDNVRSYTYDIHPNKGLTIKQKNLIFTNDKLCKDTKKIFTCLDYKIHDSICVTGEIPF